MKQLDSVTDQFPLPLLKAQEASTALEAYPQESWHNMHLIGLSSKPRGRDVRVMSQPFDSIRHSVSCE